MIGKNSIPTHQSVLCAGDCLKFRFVFLCAQIFVFSIQSYTRSPSVVNFSEGKKYVTLTGRKKVEMVAVILAVKATEKPSPQLKNISKT